MGEGRKLLKDVVERKKPIAKETTSGITMNGLF